MHNFCSYDNAINRDNSPVATWKIHSCCTLAYYLLNESDAQGEEYKPMINGIHLYVEDCDATYKRALDAGASSIREPADQFYGDRIAGVKDRFGNRWWIATHKEDLSKEEIAKRMDEAMKQHQH